MPNFEKKPSLLARAVAKFVRDSEPEEGAQAIDDMLETGDAFPGMPEQEPEQDAAPAAFNPDVPAVPQQDAPAAPAADPMQQILAILGELKAALVKPKAEPLDELEKELAGAKPAAPAAPAAPKPAAPMAPPMGGNVVPAEKMHDEEPDEMVEDEDLPEEETQDEEAEEAEIVEDCGSATGVAKDTNAALLSVLKDMRKVVAGLPEVHRKKVADSMNAAMRKAAGLSPEARSTNAIAAGKKVVKDSAPVDDRDLGRNLMAKYNPHYKK